ncbi:hypothetical protein MKEN_01264400 [Mycena kentingensis (nom. inval.)]|nr:hypothetical protein MKEN_01264400 [Mycena kentingensis (nom. inval.)]
MWTTPARCSTTSHTVFMPSPTLPALAESHQADGSGSGLDKGWIPWYSDSGYNADFGQGGAGTSFHHTSLNGASVSLRFYGSGVDLYGSANCSYDVSVDGHSSSHDSSNGDVLASLSGLAVGTHSVVLTARPTGAEQLFAFDRAVVSSPYEDPPTELFYDNADFSVLTYSSGWAAAQAPGIPNSTVTQPYQKTSQKGSSVSMDFSGVVGVSIWGMANYGDWLYTVNLDGQESSHNGSTFWKVPDALLFYQGGLDPKTNHTITLTNDNDGMNLHVNSFRTYRVEADAVIPSSGSTFAPAPSVIPSISSAPAAGIGPIPANSSPETTSVETTSVGADSGSGSHHNRRTIGIVAGAVAAAAVVLLFAFWWLLWRHRQRGHRIRQAAGVNDDTTPRPFLQLAAAPPVVLSSKLDPRETNFLPVGDAFATLPVVIPSSKRTRVTLSLTVPSPRHPAPPPTPASGPPSSQVSTVQVDRIVEMIAQRIDQRRNSQAIAPPQYPV